MTGVACKIIIMMWLLDLAYDQTSTSYLSFLNYNILNFYLKPEYYPKLRHFGYKFKSHWPTSLWTSKFTNRNKLLLPKARSFQRPMVVLDVLLIPHFHLVEYYWSRLSLKTLLLNITSLDLVILAVSRGCHSKDKDWAK